MQLHIFFAQCLHAVCDFTLFYFLFSFCFLFFLFAVFHIFFYFPCVFFLCLPFALAFFWSLNFGFLFSLSSTAFVSIILGAATTLLRVCVCKANK